MSDLAGGGEGGNGPERSTRTDLSDFGAAQAPQVDPADSEGLEPRIPGLIRHGRCGKGWTGPSRAHCGKCHNTFSSGAFDQHQRIPHGVVICSTEGLVPAEKPWGTLWSLPGVEGESIWERRRREAREAEEDAA